MRDETQNAMETTYTVIESLPFGPLRSFMYFVLKEVGSEYFDAPGSRNNHHAFKGGLAYHSSTAALLGGKIADHYIRELKMDVDKTLVQVGILLHDIGKMYCYAPKEEERNEEYHGEVEKVEGGYTHTKLSHLLHHIPIGFELITNLARDFNKQALNGLKLDEETILKLQHIILSHHGRRAWSSPVIPQFVEAYIVHAVEMMDGYVDKYNTGADIRTIYDGTNY